MSLATAEVLVELESVRSRPVRDANHVGFEIAREGKDATKGEFFMPFAAGLNQHAGVVAERSRTWARRVGLLTADDRRLEAVLERAAFDQLTSLVFRDAELPELEVLNNFIISLFVFDDHLDDTSSGLGSDEAVAAHVVGYLVAASTGELNLPYLRPDTPCYDVVVALGSAFGDIAQWLIDRIERHRLRPFFSAMKDYLWGCVSETRRRCEEFSSVEDYDRVRLRCSAVAPCFELCAVLMGYELDPDLRKDRMFRNMLLNSNLSLSYVNDVFSFEKELAAGECTNLVLVLAKVHHMDLEDALGAAIGRCDEVIREFLEARENLEQDWELSSGELKYLQLMEDWMRGNLDWYNELRTQRYVEHISVAQG